MKTLVAKQKGVRAYPLDIKNAFDLKLYRYNATANYQLVVFMKIQFFFYDNDPHLWTEQEADRFIEAWDEQVKEAWGGKTLMQLESGETVYLHFDFKTQRGGWMIDHWEIYVTKIAAGAFKVSCVELDLGNVHLDSEDLNHVTGQRGAIHEFGHMLGLKDEYNCAMHFRDFKSIMHSAGESIRERHLQQFQNWVCEKLIGEHA